MIVTLNDFNTSLKSALNSNDPSVAIAADNDLDGVFSAILLDLGLYKLFDIEVETYFRDELRWEIPIDQEFDILIMVDLAYDNTPNYRRAANQARQSYAIDHHVTSEKGFPKRVVMYNPCKDGQCYLPATYLVYEVITELGVKTEPFYEYMNLLGILADAGINFIVNQDAKIEYFFDPKLKNIFEKSRVHFDYLFEQKSYDGLIYPYFKE
ncbi:MAG: DHH family phosphoesterase, partial [Candidatus Hodarchaeota archaeon]